MSVCNVICQNKLKLWSNIFFLSIYITFLGFFSPPPPSLPFWGWLELAVAARNKILKKAICHRQNHNPCVSSMVTHLTIWISFATTTSWTRILLFGHGCSYGLVISSHTSTATNVIHCPRVIHYPSVICLRYNWIVEVSWIGRCGNGLLKKRKTEK